MKKKGNKEDNISKISRVKTIEKEKGNKNLHPSFYSFKRQTLRNLARMKEKIIFTMPGKNIGPQEKQTC